ncbi:hypothetical protein IFR05_004436 [Cadophora sp. M221]|nr:hypothetical protein IFR05_004436 [Cadophora sp. M221]
MGHFFARWMVLSRFRKGRLVEPEPVVKSGATVPEVEIAVEALKSNSNTELTTTTPAETPVKPSEFSAESKTSSISISSTDEADDDFCCDCGMDCKFGGCTAFDGMS